MEEQIYRQPRRSGKKWILIIAAVFVLLLSAVAFVLTANRLSLSVELDGEPEMMLEYGGHFQDPIMTATSPTGWFGRRNTGRSFTR